MDDEIELLKAAGALLARTRAIQSSAEAEATRVAVGAIDAGVSERAAAGLLGINRRTLRAWLGKTG